MSGNVFGMKQPDNQESEQFRKRLSRAVRDNDVETVEYIVIGLRECEGLTDPEIYQAAKRAMPKLEKSAWDALLADLDHTGQ